MNTNQLIKMKRTDVRTVDKSKLVDISNVRINPKDSPEKKARDYIGQIKNPYCFLCNGFAVKIEFFDSEKTIEDCFVDYVNSLV